MNTITLTIPESLYREMTEWIEDTDNTPIIGDVPEYLNTMKGRSIMRRLLQRAE